MPEIKFERFARDCAYNKDKDREPRDLINDFRVLIDGEHRATWWRIIYGRGYRLIDVDGHEIDTRPGKRWSQIQVNSQREFTRAIVEHMELIPDQQTILELRAYREAEIEAAERAQAVARRHHRLREAGERMLKILRILQKDGAHVMGAEVRRAPLLAQINEIITEIETDVGPTRS